jgi:hypothetical protein
MIQIDKGERLVYTGNRHSSRKSLEIHQGKQADRSY